MNLAVGQQRFCREDEVRTRSLGILAIHDLGLMQRALISPKHRHSDLPFRSKTTATSSSWS